MRTPSRLLLLAAVLAVASGCDSDASGSGTARVMSMNLYLGADLFVVAQEPNPQMIPVRVAQFYGTVQASNVPERMAAIADQIVEVGPDLIGLQEVSTYYRQSPADNLPGQANTPATQVDIDFLDLLLDALEARGASYVVASKSPNADVELPATTDGRTFFDVRYQDADVILARSDVQTSGARTASYSTLLTVPVGGVDQTFVRGFQSVEATVDDITFTFFNTHLEVGGEAKVVQELQAVELRTAVAGTSGPVVLVGDLNSDAGGTNTESYATVTQILTDAFGAGAGAPTCCQTPMIRNATSQHQTRIDLILYRGFDDVDATDTFFDTAAERTASGLWPSDHAGVWADLTIE